jgi:hypothetical protein
MHIAIRADQGRDLDPRAADIPDKITKDRKRGDSARLIRRFVLPAPRHEPACRGERRGGGSQREDMAPAWQWEAPDRRRSATWQRRRKAHKGHRKTAKCYNVTFVAANRAQTGP